MLRKTISNINPFLCICECVRWCYYALCVVWIGFWYKKIFSWKFRGSEKPKCSFGAISIIKTIQHLNSDIWVRKQKSTYHICVFYYSEIYARIGIIRILSLCIVSYQENMLEKYGKVFDFYLGSKRKLFNEFCVCEGVWLLMISWVLVYYKSEGKGDDVKWKNILA